jgi:DNA polymerase-3 subunit delta'
MEYYPWNEAPLARLSRSLGRLPQTWLIHGPTGIGKLGFALALARGMLCETTREQGAAIDLIACEQCDACLWFEQGNHPDFRLLTPDVEEGEADGETRKAASAQRIIKVEPVREAIDFLSLTAHRGGRRVLVVHPAEAMNANAANAFLKTLEEPRPGSHILLVGASPARLPATVVSRCHRLALPLPDRDEARAWLRAQNVADADSALDLAGGAPLKAREQAGEVAMLLRQRLLDTLAQPTVEGILAFAEKLDRPAQALAMETLQVWTADLMRVRLTGEIRHLERRGADLKRLAARANLPRLLDFEARLREMRRSLDHPLSVPLQWEAALLDYMDTVTHG